MMFLFILFIYCNSLQRLPVESYLGIVLILHGVVN